ncbi:MAG: radical SAM protein, partial [Deltaproteobacteria bacterium]|nr:radical SAM protein [Deltaproteobacteria bacterium]
MGRNSKLKAGTTGKHDYLSIEKGSIKKKWKNKIPVALIYPNNYSLGMSNLGFQLVYHLLNRDYSVVAERVFLPESATMPLSVESGRPLADFPFLFFSVSFEQDYRNLVLLLELAGIPSPAAQRAKKSENISALAAGDQPLVVAGGVTAFMNPEPLAFFVDLFIIGEAEPILPQVMSLLKTGIGKDKNSLLLKAATGIPGCYVPSLYKTEYNEDGRLVTTGPVGDSPAVPARIKKIIMDSPGDLASHSKILSPAAEFSDLFMTELGRGCSRGCRFCAAGYIYRPPRLWKAETIINAVASRPSGCSRIGLLGMEMAQPEDVSSIADYLADKSCSLSFSSLRADIISSSLTDLLGQSNLKSVAIAPDGGSERLRRVINKG